MTGRDMRRGMGRAERRAKDREEAERKRTPRAAPGAPSGESLPRTAGDSSGTQDETARRIYRTGGTPERVAKTRHGVREKRLKWREGRQ
jgi:hypothetical protein